MIITRLTGGLGNQMFQYAAGLALAYQRRTVLKLDVSWYREYAEYEEHNRYGLSCFNVTEQFATLDEVERLCGVRLTRVERWSVIAARRLRFHRYADRLGGSGSRHCARDQRYYPEFLELPDGTYLDGMWQSEQFFSPVANVLRLHFTFRYPALPAVRSLADRIRSGPSAAVHFRRGDYVRNRHFAQEIGVIPDDYYHRAIEELRKRCPAVTLYIFSDDIDSVEREFHLQGPHVFVRATESWHAYDKIRLMGMCDHAIVANSTFSWWAAWLNQSPEKIIIAPDPWFSGTTYDGADVVPTSWIRLPVIN